MLNISGVFQRSKSSFKNIEWKYFRIFENVQKILREVLWSVKYLIIKIWNDLPLKSTDKFSNLQGASKSLIFLQSVICERVLLRKNQKFFLNFHLGKSKEFQILFYDLHEGYLLIFLWESKCHLSKCNYSRNSEVLKKYLRNQLFSFNTHFQYPFENHMTIKPIKISIKLQKYQ